MTKEHQRRTRELFDAALDQPAESRSVFLAAACDGDYQILGAVRRLLDAHARSAGVLDDPAWERRVSAEDPQPAGSYVGPYKILQELGSGGMGHVYQAVRADEVFHRVCAVKVIRAELASPWLLERFRRERQILAQLDHVNIARIVDGGSTPDGVPYFVMDYVDGVSINQFCTQHDLSVRARLMLFQQICAAVQYLHLNQVVHGDLKPPNILVDREGGVKLIDFGIASALSGGSVPAQERTLPLMTMAYASPEQLRGEPLSPGSDVYSLGIVLYELLSGRRPFLTATRNTRDLLREIEANDPMRPSKASELQGASPLRSQADTRRMLRGDLDAIVLRAMHGEPAKRYRSVAELRHDLDSYLANRPIVARERHVAYRSGKFLARHQGLVLAASLFVVLLGALSWQGVELHRRYELSQQLEDQVRSLQAQIEDELRQRMTDASPSSGPGPGLNRSAADHIKLAQLSNVRDLATACRTSFSESTRLWGGMTPPRRELIDHAHHYLLQVEPYVADEPGAGEQLASAWLDLANVQGNPQTVNLNDRTGAMASLGEAIRLLDSSHDQSSSLVNAVRSAEASVETAGK